MYLFITGRPDRSSYYTINSLYRKRSDKVFPSHDIAFSRLVDIPYAMGLR